MSQLAWHYTIGINFELIVESGLLMTTLAGCPESEKPVLWFSMNQKWEPTVNPLVIDKNNQIRRMTLEETMGEFQGLMRFGYPCSQLIPWAELWRQANISPQMKRALEKTGREQGAKPSHWMGCLHDIPINELVIEVMDNHNVWKRIQTVNITGPVTGHGRIKSKGGTQ